MIHNDIKGAKKRMLIVETIAKIRRMYHIQHKGFKTIARELSLSKNTVKKIIRLDLIKQVYTRKVQPHKVLGPYRERLEARLEDDRSEPVRRRRTAKKLCEELRTEGYAGSYEAVNNYVSGWKLNRDELSRQSFVPLKFAPGEAFQFDWSEEEIKLAGEMVRIKVAHIRLCHSRFFLIVAYRNEQQEMVMDAHDKAFKFFAGSCLQGIYDNMKTAVTKIGKGKERTFNNRFKELASHHLFEPVACTPRSGWEKGQVEKQVCTSRRNFFTPLVQVNTLDELNQQLEQGCVDWAKKTRHPEKKEETVWSVYEEEKQRLVPYQSAFNGYKLVPTSVSSTCMVEVNTNSYSVDCHYVRKAVEVRVYAKRVTVYYGDTLIAEHDRTFKRHQKIYNPWHYVPILERKPGALRHGAPFNGWQLPDGLKQVREKLSRHADGDKQFIKLLLEVKNAGLAAVNTACEKALAQGISQAGIIIDYLYNKVIDNTLTSNHLTLAYPPSDTCDSYNQLYQQHMTVSLQGATHGA